ncbi:exodeoxyribonuclease V subunit alpha [Geomonas subterranea]|uniref:Exodeoxyribonuclease V subunit alpha n=1 Tax=Geomonas subterranea TaxID=2847989 RepID=A0ABX8LCD9_9BACT|nr:exodeoxyribonuclease V subunit alpha [Geomonas subterranea]QXE89688.1 exodeoxyribonuclease V subunit alpha [Geomonas subterranea]QXM08196.1 exodeoxyribonuclease V subunit alpha [Geomonas subterranea]
MAPEGVQLDDIDRQFAAFICRLAGSRDQYLEAAAALLSRGVTGGDVCLDLETALEEGRAAGYRLESANSWRERLQASPVVGAAGEFKPLILDHAGRLYLQRYWRYENELAEAILKRGEPAPFDREPLRQGLARLFPPTPGETDWQRLAALAAVTRRFCVISGGPGTGKTTTVVKVLSLLLEQSEISGTGSALRIALAAPTGKAAARLKESISGGLEKADPKVRGLIPEEVFTLHRLLGYLKGSSGFRHNSDNPLPYDVVIVDEASMVSLPLMAKLVCALRQDTRLILLGDRDQLASVEAGAILGDMCDTGGVHGFSPEFAELSADVAGDAVDVQPGIGPLGDAVVLLRKSYRFSSSGGIGKVASLVNSGDAHGALSACLDPALAGVSLASLPPAPGLAEALARRITDGYGAYLRTQTPEEAFAEFSRFRILCAMRSGPFGVEAINVLVRQRLAQAGLIDPHGRCYAGEPVMITRNDYNLGLFNGDVGLILPDAGNGGELRAFFPTGSGGMRKVLPLRLPEYECAFAMTVHKSQGSEFDKVLLVLPDRDNPVLTRELIYTAITRAKKSVELLADQPLFVTAVGRRVTRRSGLRERLWGN